MAVSCSCKPQGYKNPFFKSHCRQGIQAIIAGTAHPARRTAYDGMTKIK